jgi:hypothetical protein
MRSGEAGASPAPRRSAAKPYVCVTTQDKADKRDRALSFCKLQVK